MDVPSGQKSNAKLIQYELPQSDENYKLIELSQRHRQALIASCTYLRWMSRHSTLPADLITNDALDAWVSDLELRLMVGLDLCQIIQDCIGAQLDSLQTTVNTIQSGLDDVTQQLEANVQIPFEPIIEPSGSAICGGAAFVVDFMDSEIRRVYQQAEDGLLDNLVEASAAILRAIPVIETLPLDDMLEGINFMFANQVADYITDFTARRGDLIGSLSCFVEINDDTFDYQIWGDWLEFVGEEYSDRAAMLFSMFSPLRQSFLSDILAGVFNRPTLKQWFDMIMLQYLAGSEVPIACPTYVCPFIFSVSATVDPFETDGVDSGFDVTSGIEVRITAEGVWNGGAGGDVNADGFPPDAGVGFRDPAANTYELIFKIGTGGIWQAAGVEKIFTPPASGRLFFALNDLPTAYPDNSGSLTVMVRNT